MIIDLTSTEIIELEVFLECEVNKIESILKDDFYSPVLKEDYKKSLDIKLSILKKLRERGN